MRGEPFLASYPPLARLLILLGLVLIFMFGGSVIGLLYAVVQLGPEVFTDDATLQQYDDPAVVHVLKVIQLFTALGMFFVPAWLFARFVSREPRKFMFLHTRPKVGSLVIAGLLIFTALPIINFVYELNMSLDLPDGWLEESLRGAEGRAEVLTKAFLTMDGYGDLAFNLVLIALIPAIGEELLFRGVIQRMFVKSTGNIHIGIWITAALFSAIHFQFYGFVPRMLLGALLGYLLAWSGSLWVPILGHFINNGAAVYAQWLTSQGVVPEDIEDVGAAEGEWMFVLISVALTAMLLFALYRGRTNSYNQLVEPPEPPSEPPAQGFVQASPQG